MVSSLAMRDAGSFSLLIDLLTRAGENDLSVGSDFVCKAIKEQFLRRRLASSHDHHPSVDGARIERSGSYSRTTNRSSFVEGWSLYLTLASGHLRHAYPAPILWYRDSSL